MTAPRTTAPQVRVRLCPDGPMLVSGAATVVTEDGTEVAAPRRTVAVCRCGRSSLRPWCDGTHKLLRDDAAPGGSHGRSGTG